MSDISSRDLGNRTAEVLRRVEAGEKLRVTVNRRRVAELVPLGPQRWASGATMERILRESPADAELLSDLRAVRGQVIGKARVLGQSSTSRSS